MRLDERSDHGRVNEVGICEVDHNAGSKLEEIIQLGDKVRPGCHVVVTYQSHDTDASLSFHIDRASSHRPLLP